MSRPRHEDMGSWYPIAPELDWLLEPGRLREIGWAAAIAALGVAISLPAAMVWMIPLGLLGWAASRWGLKGRTVGFRLDSEGLWEARLGAADRHFPWNSIRAVEETKDQMLVRTDAGTVRMSREVAAAFHLAQHLRQGLGDTPAAEATVSPEQIEEWLGLQPGGVLQFGSAEDPERVFLGCGLLLAVAAVAQVWAFGRGVAWLVLPTAAWLWLMLPVLDPPMTISARGICRLNGWAASWEDVIGSTLTGGICRLRTTRGGIAIPGRHARVVHDTVHKVLEAKRAGAVAPRMDGVPDTALSRAETAEQLGERGISRAEDGLGGR